MERDSQKQEAIKREKRDKRFEGEGGAGLLH